MATKYHNLSDYNPQEMPDKNIVAQQRYGIVVSDWNSEITFALLQGAIDVLIDNGVKQENIIVKHVPGAFELTFAAKKMMNENLHAIIAIGCVIQGDTPYFTYICQGVTEGLSVLNAQMGNNCPIIFSVLTTDTLEQAQDRAGGKLGNKGAEGAVTAIKMANF